jgi:hypothetical protein
MPVEINSLEDSRFVEVEDEHGHTRMKLRTRYDNPEGNYFKRRRKAKQAKMVRIMKGPDERGYTWTAGYNSVLGQFTGGRVYPRLTGSSLNRKKKPKQGKFFIDEKDISKSLSSLPSGAGDSFKMAIKAAKEFRRRGLPIPDAIRNFLVIPSEDNEREFRLWLSESKGGPIIGMGLPIHVLSSRSRGKIKDKATAFFRASAGNRSFVTLTFIDAVDDQTGVSILNKFLTSIRKEYEKLQYLWVAERQTNNPDFPYNIHFHAILNQRLPVGRWNALWVLQQYNAGLIGRNKYGDLVSKEEILELYKLDAAENFRGIVGRTGKRISRIQAVFNPMDAKKIKSINGLSMYLTKYITKQERGTTFGCAVWHCSRTVSRLFTRSAVGPSAFAYMMSLANARVDKETGEVFMPERVKPKRPGDNFYVMVYVNNKQEVLRYLREMEQVNKWQLAGAVQIDKPPQIDDDMYRAYFCKN